jgi:hypothetical protein
VTFWVNLLKTVKITYFCHKKCKNSTLIDNNLRILPVFIWFWCFIKSEIFIWLYQTVNMLIVFRFAYWLKNGITHQNQMKTDIAVKNCDFLGYFTKTVKIPFFCHQKWKNSTVIENKSQNFASFHLILMFYTILESEDKANDNGWILKAIKSIKNNTLGQFSRLYAFLDMH